MLDDVRRIIARFTLPSADAIREGQTCRRVMKRCPPKNRVISVVNQKGGCAKTTTAINLSAWLADKKYKVLLIDLDPQAHASLGLGVDVDSLKHSVYHVLTEGRALETVIHETCVSGLAIAPANSYLSGAQLDIVGYLGREGILKYALRKLALRTTYDYIVIDCSPSLNLININALAASDYVLVPILPHYYSLEGMRELFQTIDTVKERLNGELELLGILVTLFDTRMRVNHEMIRQIRDYFKELVFDTIIRLNVKLSEAPIHKRPIHLYAPGSRGAYDYFTLSNEVVFLTDPKRRRMMNDTGIYGYQRFIHAGERVA